MVIDSTEIYEAVPTTELNGISEVNLNEDNTESVTHDIHADNSESVAPDSSDTVVGSTVQTVDYTSSLDSIANDVHVIMFIVLFSFCWSCIKSWRSHSLKGVRK